MYAKIGNITLSGMLGMEEVSTETSINAVEQPLINNTPIIQVIGSDLQKKKLAVVLHSQFCVPEDVISQFSQYCTNVIPVNITLGTGQDLGNWLIVKVNQEQIQSTPTGGIVQARIELDLWEYTGAMPTNAPPAMLSTNPVITPTVPVSVAPAGVIVNGVVAAQGSAAEINTGLTSANATQAGSVTQRKIITNTLLKVQNANESLAGVYTASSNVLQYVNQAQNLKQRVQIAQTQLSSLKAFLQIKDLQSANAANKSFQGSMSLMGNLTSPFTQQYVLRRSV